MIQVLKRDYPQGLIVAGGPQITSNPEIIKVMDIPYGFRGDAEFVFAGFCKAVISGREPDVNASGLVVYKEGKLLVKEPAFIAHLDDLPMPAFSLYGTSIYTNIVFSKEKAFTFITSRGCPFDCMFCDKLFRTRYRHHSTAYVIEALQQLRNMGIGTIDFVDESFTVNRERITDLCRAIIENKLDLSWGCWTRADLLDEELLITMKNAGLKRILLGVETGNEALRFSIRKKITNKMYTVVVEACRRLGIITECTFIFGHPGETPEQMRETIDFACALDPDFAFFYKLNVVPSSEIFERYKAEQNKDASLFEDYMLSKEPYPFYHPEGVDNALIDTMVNEAYNRFYVRPGKSQNTRKHGYLANRL
ncbi:MAG: coproporphyrinogen III oxidase [Bacteroidetes bacterium ADurb.Bin408]|nr:MAG: coproporphyrinogen III oxidase [Bacteroidetes bacterium ADurb.Bin408]